MSYTLLIIDDDEDIRLILTSVLASVDGLTVYEADCGATAQDHFQTQSIDGILLDYQLPDTSGEELLKIFMKTSQPPKPDVVMLSARDELELSQRWIELGAKAVLTKPFNPFELLAQLRVHFEF